MKPAGMSWEEAYKQISALADRRLEKLLILGLQARHEVAECATCPMLGVDGSDCPVCQHPDVEHFDVMTPEPVPPKCPLRQGPLTIELAPEDK